MTMTPPPHPSLAERIYRRLLRILPPDFRGDFAESMAQDFRDRDRELTGVARRRFHVRELPALVRTASVQWLDAAWRDLRFAFRMMGRAPGFTVAAVAMLAIGTGANAAMFSVVDAVLVRPSANDPSRVASIEEMTPTQAASWTIPIDHFDRLLHVPEFEYVAGTTGSLAILGGAGAPHRIDVDCVSAAMFPLLESTAALGRVFTADDDRVGAEPVIVLSHNEWVDDFGGAADVVGRRITLNGVSNTVVGVMPEGFLGPMARNTSAAWAPLTPAIGRTSPTGCSTGRAVDVVARIKSPMTLDEAAARVNAAGRLAGLRTLRGELSPTLVLVRADDNRLGRLRTPLEVLLGAVGCVLLIACANVANLQLERLVSRRREIAVRLALGATRGRLVRQTLVESLLLVSLGALAGLLVAKLTMSSLVALMPANTPHIRDIAVNTRTLVATVGAAMVMGLLIGILPARQTTRRQGVSEVIHGGRGSVGGAAWTQRGLVVGEVALSVVLLIAAGLMIRTFLILQPVAPGFGVADRTIAEMSFSGDWVVDPDRARVVDAIRERVGALPGVAAVSATTYLPLSGSTDLTRVTIASASADVWTSWSTADYFKDMDMRLDRGRFFTEADNASAPTVAIVNAAMARRFWPADDPLGRTILVRRPDKVEIRATVVGVVGTARSWGTDVEERSELLLSYPQGPGPSLIYFVIHTNGAPSTTLPADIRRIADVVRPGQVVDRIESMQTKVNRSIAAPRFAMVLFGAFAAAGATLAALGLAAVLAWWVAARRKEIGVRMALGASVERVAMLVLGEGLGLAASGLAIGLGASLLVTRLLKDWLYDVAAPTDVRTFFLCGLGMLAVTALATYIPARRAARIDPLVTLKAE